MKRLIQKTGNWLARTTGRIFNNILRFIKKLPGNVRQLIFTFAFWAKTKLDQFINKSQRKYLHRVIFENETREGRQFDYFILAMIVASVVTVIMESVTEFRKTHWWVFFILEWIFTLIFTVEYILRLYSSRNALRYATSFFGVIDLLAILPTYLSIFVLGAQNLLIIRALRLLRVFRIFEMGNFVKEGAVVVSALRASKTKIYVFMTFVLLSSMLIGTMMYMVEGGVNDKFSNIPEGIYWAIVTLTTVGYGDITPVTPFGRFLATVIMVLGYGVIAVPTGIVTAEISGRVMNLKEVEFTECPSCGQPEHHTGSTYCHKCGHQLERA